MTYKKLKNNACVMVTAAKGLELFATIGLNESEDEKMGEYLAHMMMPALILRAFSCELILKSLSTEAIEDTNGTCKLNDLYHMVGEATREAIADAVIRKMKVHNSNYGTDDFLIDLNSAANVFIDWRHFYENPRALNTSFFESFFNELVKYTLPK